MTTTTTTKPLDLNPIARTLVPFFVEHIAAARAWNCAHISQIRAAGGRVAHIRTTQPRWSRARAALVRALERNEPTQEERRAAFACAQSICRDETRTREAGNVWNADAAIDAWMALI